jgi:hypothetical protein
MGRVAKEFRRQEFRRQEFRSCRGQEFRITISVSNSNGLDSYAIEKARKSHQTKRS